MLKALILSAVPQAQEGEILGSFRSATAHYMVAASVCGKRRGQDAFVYGVTAYTTTAEHRLIKALADTLELKSLEHLAST
jgi:hypothetical protein